MKIFWLPFLLAVVFEPIRCQENPKLLLVQILFRHGDRAPVKLYKTDPNPLNLWPEGLGKLTLLGKRQQYSLGKLFRSMYQNFVTSNPNEVTVNSSASDRCIRSAAANIASFYSPSPEWVFDAAINWQPIPVYSLPEKEDKYLAAQIPCPRADELSKRTLRSKEVQQIFMNHKEMLDDLSIHSGESLNTFLNILLLEDTLFAEKQHNLIIPPWTLPYMDKLKSLVNLVFHYLAQPLTVQKLRIGPLLGKIVSDMNEKSTGGIPSIKVRLYSSHDYEVNLMLEALKVPNYKQPPYCASVVFELREKLDGQKVVRLLYLNSTTPEDGLQEPYVLILDGCSEYCPLDYFVSYTRSIIPEDWERECQLYESNLASSKEPRTDFFRMKMDSTSTQGICSEQEECR